MWVALVAGNTFDPRDFVAYVIDTAVALMWDRGAAPRAWVAAHAG